MQPFTLFKVLERLGSQGWRGVLENTRRLTGLLNRILCCVSGGPAKGHCIAIYTMSKRIISLYRRSDALFASMYLKQVSFNLQQYLGARKENRPNQKVFVSLTRCGIPRFIPPIYRKRIRVDRDPMVIRIVLSVCTLCRVILVFPKSKRKVDTSTIVASGIPFPDEVYNIAAFIQEKGFAYLKRYCPGIFTRQLHLGYKFGILLSAGPNTGFPCAKQSYLATLGLRSFDKLTVYHTLPLDSASCLLDGDNIFFSNSAGVFYPDRTYLAGDMVWNYIPPKEHKMPIRAYLEALVDSARQVYGGLIESPTCMARLGVKLEGAGKVRIFVMGNPVIQTLLRPLHDWSMGLLSTLSTDGTYDQLAPLKKLAGHKCLYSFDLKSATDLFPVDQLAALLASCFGSVLGTSWCNLMTNFSAVIPETRWKAKNLQSVHFRRGQPLGFYSSWSVFTLTHHLLVWIAAEKVYRGRVFQDYAILGDDIVIADERVALEYSDFLARAGGVISLEKSLISHNGSCEFAKRFIINNHLPTRADVSPLSLPFPIWSREFRRVPHLSNCSKPNIR